MALIEQPHGRHGRGHRPRRPTAVRRRVLVPAGIGNFTEWYDFVVSPAGRHLSMLLNEINFECSGPTRRTRRLMTSNRSTERSTSCPCHGSSQRTS
jgi:hypothetical protein